MFMSDVTLGTLIIVISMLCGFVFCIGTCLILWVRHREGAVPTLCSKFLFRQRSLTHDLTPSEAAANEILVFPTITHSEPGSEPCSPNSSSIPLNPYDKKYFQTFPDTLGWIPSPDRSPKSFDYARRYPSSPSQRRTPMFNHDYHGPRQPRPSSLKLGPPASPTVSSESGTSASPAEFESFRMHFRHSEISYSSTDEHSACSSTTTPDRPIFCKTTQSDQKHKFKIGTLKINIKYFSSEKNFQINLLNDYQLPTHIQCKEKDLYAKFSLTIGESRIRCSKPLKSAPHDTDGDVVATFEHEADVQELSQASVVTTLCKKMPTSDQGMVVGCAFVNIGALSLSASEDFDSGKMELPLEDCNPYQMMFCGGFLQCLIDLPSQVTPLSLTNIQLSGMDLDKIFSDDKSHAKDYVQLYLKITVYENGEAVFWRRTSPVIVTTTSQRITLANQVVLEVTPKNLNTLQLVLSVRLKTGKRGERCILGNIYLGESWFSDEVAARKKTKGFSSKIMLHLPLDH